MFTQYAPDVRGSNPGAEQIDSDLNPSWADKMWAVSMQQVTTTEDCWVEVRSHGMVAWAQTDVHQTNCRTWLLAVCAVAMETVTVIQGALDMFWFYCLK